MWTTFGRRYDEQRGLVAYAGLAGSCGFAMSAHLSCAASLAHQGLTLSSRSQAHCHSAHTAMRQQGPGLTTMMENNAGTLCQAW